MKPYQQELFDFLVQEENFTRMQQMRVFHDDVLKPKLIEDFWIAVNEAINQKKDEWEELRSWKTWFKYGDNEGLCLYSKDWITDVENEYVPFACRFNNLESKVDYCIKIYEDTYSDWNFDKLKNTIESSAIKMTQRPKDKSCLCYGFMGEDHFQSKETLTQILPSNRESKVHEYTEWMIDLARTYGPDLDKFFREQRR